MTSNTEEINLEDFPTDILQYTINGYLDFQEDIPKVEQLLTDAGYDFKFDRNQHIYVEDTYYKDTKTLLMKRTFLDQVIIKLEVFSKKGKLELIQFYKNGMLTKFEYISKHKDHARGHLLNGKLNGKYERFLKGETVSEFNYKEGIPVGLQWNIFAKKDHEKIVWKNDQNGKVIWSKRYDKDGNLIDENTPRDRMMNRTLSIIANRINRYLIL